MGTEQRSDHQLWKMWVTGGFHKSSFHATMGTSLTGVDGGERGRGRNEGGKLRLHGEGSIPRQVDEIIRMGGHTWNSSRPAKQPPWPNIQELASMGQSLNGHEVFASSPSGGRIYFPAS